MIACVRKLGELCQQEQLQASRAERRNHRPVRARVSLMHAGWLEFKARGAWRCKAPGMRHPTAQERRAAQQPAEASALHSSLG
jgi:hypothetical protein